MGILTSTQITRSEKCLHTIAAAMQGGSISFEQYMQICLYEDRVGYYQSGEDIFGEQGDFTTSPERSTYFAAAFANYIVQLSKQMIDFTIIEIGAGSGKFANDLINYLKHRECLPEKYIIVEKSETLQQRQQQRLSVLSEYCDFTWEQTIDQPVCNAIVIANEVLDAIPVRLLALGNNTIKEKRVILDDAGNLQWSIIEADEKLAELSRKRIPRQLIVQGHQTYFTELNSQIDQFIKQIASFVKRGLFFYIDYGYPRAEYYHEQRDMGTLICHYKHKVNNQPLKLPGLQDISCNVDFTAVAEAADKAELQVICYTTQAHFLLASNILNDPPGDELASQIHRRQQLKSLLMPGEMGERFQVMVLNKQIDCTKINFTTRDLLHRL